MVFLAIFLLAFVPALLYAAIVFWIDRYEKEPKRLIFGCFIWGAVVAAGAAWVANTIFGVGVYLLTGDEAVTEAATSALSAPLVEEILKGFAVLLVFLLFRSELDSVLDGMVYAAITALGFAATENMLYMYQLGYLEEGWGGLWTVFVMRVVLNAWSHPTYTAFTGIGLAVARLSKNNTVRVVGPLLGLGTAVFLHFIHNLALVSVDSLPGLIMVYLVDWFGWLVMVAVIAWAVLRERGWIAAELKEEVASGLITTEQYRIVLSPLRRGMTVVNRLAGKHYKTTRQFYQQLVELAFTKHHALYNGDDLQASAARIQTIREDVGNLSRALA